MARTYSLTAGQIIAKARLILNDTMAPYRDDDQAMISWLNDAIQMAVTVNPSLFIKSAPFECVAGYRQQFDVARAVAVVDVVGVPVADPVSLSAFMPGWHNATQGNAQNWMRVLQEPLDFELYPPSFNGQTLTIHYVASPQDIVSLGDVVLLTENYAPALADYLVGRASFKDDEHVLSGRAQAFEEKFMLAIKPA